MTYGGTPDQMMAWFQANHMQVAHALSAEAADTALCARASLAHELGLDVNFYGTNADGCRF